MCLKLSNSGDILKLLVPSHSRKAMSGWTNHPCTVISLKIDENQMDNRGSKSEFLQDSVKEQRVDGSYCIKASTSRMQLRCILMNFESFSRVKFPSKQLYVKIFSCQLRKATLILPARSRALFLTPNATAFVFSSGMEHGGGGDK